MKSGSPPEAAGNLNDETRNGNEDLMSFALTNQWTGAGPLGKYLVFRYRSPRLRSVMGLSVTKHCWSVWQVRMICLGPLPLVLNRGSQWTGAGPLGKYLVFRYGSPLLRSVMGHLK